MACMLGATPSRLVSHHALRTINGDRPGSQSPLGGEGKIVQADEIYICKKGGKRKHRGAGSYGHKRNVSAFERGGRIRTLKLGSPSRAEIAGTIRTNVDRRSILDTDGARVYKCIIPPTGSTTQ